MRNPRQISFIKAARKELDAFPLNVQLEIRSALVIAARGGMSDKAKAFKGVDGGVFEIVPSDTAVTHFEPSTR